MICAVQRKNEVVIPRGDFVLQKGDKIHVTAPRGVLVKFLKQLGVYKHSTKDIMIIGGGRIGYYLADSLSQKKYAVKLIESDPARAEHLAELLPKVTVVCGNGTQHDLLMEEGIASMDAFVALTDIDEENMVVSMFSNKMKVRKTITQIKSDNLYGMLNELNLSNTVSPKRIVANRVISYIRSISNTRGSNVLTLSRLVNNQVEALEFHAKKQEDFYDRPFKELQVKDNCLIACIIRKNEVIIPNGNACIKLGDNIIVVTTHKNFDDLADVFA